MFKVIVTMPLGEQRGGGELMLLHLMQQGRDLGIDWLVIFFQDGPMVKDIADLGVRTMVVKTGHLRDIPSLIESVFKLSRIFSRERPNIVLGWMTFAGIYSGLAGFLAKVPTLYYQLATPTPGNPFEFIATQLCTFGGMTLSKAGYDIQSKLYPNKPGKLIYPGVELERFNPESLPSPSECREKLSLPKDRHIIGIVGRLQRWKGMHTVIKAMPIILEKYPDTTCVIVGGEHASEPDYPKYIKSLIAQHNLEDKVVLAGLQSNVQVWMQAMDVIIHASDREPFGIVNIEAMALGKPVVAGSKGGPAEIITQEVNGLLADYDNHEQIANCVIRYFENPEFAIKTAQAAKARASEFSSRQYAINLVNALREFVSDKNE